MNSFGTTVLQSVGSFSGKEQGVGALFLAEGDLSLIFYHLNHKLYNLEQVTVFWALVWE